MKTLLLAFILLVSTTPIFSQGDPTSISASEFDRVFTKVEKPASFPGGDISFIKFVGRNLNITKLEPFLKETPQQAIVKFIVDSTGLVSHVGIVNDKDIDPIVADEAMKLIKRGPKWQPAVQNRRNVVYLAIQSIPIPTKAEAADILQGKTSTIGGLSTTVSRETRVLTTTNFISKGIFTKAEEPATFPGGSAALQKYIEDNFNRQKLAPYLKEPQTFILSCLIDTVGNVLRVSILTKRTNTKSDGTTTEEIYPRPHSLIAAEAISLIKAGPKWNPARQKGKTVMFSLYQSITFPRIGGVDMVKFAP